MCRSSGNRPALGRLGGHSLVDDPLSLQLDPLSKLLLDDEQDDVSLMPLSIAAPVRKSMLLGPLLLVLLELRAGRLDGLVGAGRCWRRRPSRRASSASRSSC